MKRYFIIILAIVLLIIILIFTFFKIETVPDVKNEYSYSIKKKDLDGLQLFYDMLNVYFGDVSMAYVEADDFSCLEGREKTLLIGIQRSISLDSTLLSQLSDFVSRGNEVLMIGSSFDLEGYEHISTENGFFSNDTLFQLIWEDGDRLQYQPFREGRINPYVPISHFEEDYTGALEPLLFRKDSLNVFSKATINSQSICIHSAPLLFQNRSSESTSYLANFNKTFQYFNSERVILHQFKLTNIRASTNQESILKYILSQRALKYAYYLTLLCGLLYVIFSSKRKQRQIPIIEESKNTSLDYIETASSLFMAQNQNEKLVKHMRRNFIYKVKSAYFLNPDDPLFSEKLAKKSRCPIDLINSIMNQLNLSDTHSFNDDQLIRLYSDINTFNQNRK